MSACSLHEKSGWTEATAVRHIFLNKPFAESLNAARCIECAVAAGVKLVHDVPVHGAHPITANPLV